MNTLSTAFIAHHKISLMQASSKFVLTIFNLFLNDSYEKPNVTFEKENRQIVSFNIFFL